MKRGETLYDSITEIREEYLSQAEEFCPQKPHPTALAWKRWAALAAAVLLVVGVGSGVFEQHANSSAEPSTAGSALQSPGEEENRGSEAVLEDQADTVFGREIHLENGQIWALLPPEAAGKLDLPDDLDKLTAEEPILWLQEMDGVYVPADGPTQTALYSYTEDVSIICDDGMYYAAVVKRSP